MQQMVRSPAKKGVNVTKSANGQLTYDFSGDQQETKRCSIHCILPKAVNMRVILPGWYKSLAELRFKAYVPVVFSGKEPVDLADRGSLFLKMRHLKEIPFIITTGNQAIEATKY